MHFLEPKGMLGTITSHTGFFLVSLQKWREAVLLQEARLIVYTNLGVRCPGCGHGPRLWHIAWKR